MRESAIYLTVQFWFGEEPQNMNSNTEIVQAAYGRFAVGDIPGLLGLCNADIDWEVPEIEGSNFGGKWHGHEGVGKFFGALAGDEDITVFEPRQFIADGGNVVVLGRSASTVKSTGKSYATDWVHVFIVNDGLITGFHEFFDNAAAGRAFQR